MQHLLNVIRGALIGSAELVPGISGGTVALIVGIYERALHNANSLLNLKFKQVEWLFLAAVGLGMFGAVFGFSTALHSFVENQYSASHALFFGMVLVSIAVPWTMMDRAARRSAPALLTMAIAAVLVFIITGWTSDPVANPSLIVVFFAASIAICALVLPGVSGSLILLTLGLYEPIIGAVSRRDIPVLLVFAAGAACGLIAFVKLLNYLLSSHRTITLAAMAGFMLGSLRALWPAGAQQDASALTIVLLIVLGGLIVGGFIVADQRLNQKSRQLAAQAHAHTQGQ